jgi:hypothetical protein
VELPSGNFVIICGGGGDGGDDFKKCALNMCTLNYNNLF